MTEPRDDLVCVGAVAGAFGVKGELRLKSFTSEPETLFELGPMLDERGDVFLTLGRWRVIPDGYAAFAKEAPTREAAMALASRRLYVTRATLPETEEDEFYHADLIGLRVVSLQGADLGEIRSVQNYGASDLLEIWKTPGVRQPWMLPFTREAVPHVDLAQGVVTVDPPEGMLPGSGPEAEDDADAGSGDGGGDGGGD
jgi:16S rRNA processing protein RimM